MKTLTDLKIDIHNLLIEKTSPKKLRRSKTIFYTQKYVEYDYKLNPTIDDFIEQVSFSIRWCYIEWWYALKLYSIWWKVFCNASSDDVFINKEECIKSLWKDPVESYKRKRKQHYKNLYIDKLQKRNKLWDEMEEISKILTNL